MGQLMESLVESNPGQLESMYIGSTFISMVSVVTGRVIEKWWVKGMRRLLSER